jgi:hypothetical protein
MLAAALEGNSGIDISTYTLLLNSLPTLLLNKDHLEDIHLQYHSNSGSPFKKVSAKACRGVVRKQCTELDVIVS